MQTVKVADRGLALYEVKQFLRIDGEVLVVAQAEPVLRGVPQLLQFHGRLEFLVSRADKSNLPAKCFFQLGAHLEQARVLCLQVALRRAVDCDNFRYQFAQCGVIALVKVVLVEHFADCRLDLSVDFVEVSVAVQRVDCFRHELREHRLHALEVVAVVVALVAVN